MPDDDPKLMPTMVKQPKDGQAPPDPEPSWADRLGTNYDHASSNLSLNEQERKVYLHHLNNLHKGGVKNEDGTTSTFRAITAGIGDKTYVLPTVWNNKIVSNEQAIKRAKMEGLDNYPSYPSHEQALKRYMQIHDYMEGDLR